VVEDL